MVLLMLIVGCQSIDSSRPCKFYVATNAINESLMNDLKVLSSKVAQGRKTGSIGSQFSYQYIAKRYHELGLRTLSPNYLSTFNHRKLGDEIGTNVIGFIEGDVYPNQYIVVTAHYDHLGGRGNRIFYGADDNASGVAMMLALAQHIVDASSKYSVIFVATDAEEKGLLGSHALLASTLMQDKAIRFNINLDMLARAKRLYYLTSIPRTHALHDDISQIKQSCMINRRHHRNESTGKIIDYKKASDHWVFAKNNIDFVFIGGGLHDDYHRIGDSFSKISPVRFSNRLPAIIQLFELVEHSVMVD